MSRVSTGPSVIRKTSDPGASMAGSAPGYSAGSSGRSEIVKWPVAATKAANRAFVTVVSSIQKPPTLARCAGRSSG
jgi:hypothetical protein